MEAQCTPPSPPTPVTPELADALVHVVASWWRAGAPMTTCRRTPDRDHAHARVDADLVLDHDRVHADPAGPGGE